MSVSVDPTYVVAPISAGSWTLRQQGRDEILYQGSFWNTWSFARTVGSRSAPSRLVALSEEGRLIAQELLPSGADRPGERAMTRDARGPR